MNTEVSRIQSYDNNTLPISIDQNIPQIFVIHVYFTCTKIVELF